MTTTSIARTPKLEIALSHARGRLPVFPVCAPIQDGTKCSASWHTHGPDYVGKTPLVKEWQNKATVDEAQIRKWWSEYPDANIGTPTQDTVTVDIDVRHDGFKSLERMEATHGPLNLTRTHETGTGGEHRIFANRSGLDLRNAAPLEGYPGIDVRANGGFILLPGSVHRSGKAYSLKVDLPVEDAQPWLIDLVVTSNHNNGHQQLVGADGELIPHGHHDAWLTSRAGGYRRNGDTEEIIADKLMLDFQRLENQDPAHPYTRDDALRIAKSIAKKPVGAPKKPEPEPKPDPKTWSVDALLDANLPDLTFRVADLIPDESLIVLAGRKKLGKTFMVLQLGTAVASGGLFLGKRCTKGTVLILALEDGERRLVRRIKQQKTPRNIPLRIKFQMEPLDKENGGLAQLKRWIEELKPCLVIIDTLAKALSHKLDQNSAGETAEIVNALHTMTVQYHLSIILIAHHGKMAYGDAGMDIRGSSAIPGATDGNFGLYRQDTDYFFKGESRDIEEFNLKIYLDKEETWCWQLLGDTKQVLQQMAQQAVLDALAVLGEADVSQIASEAALDRSTIRARCKSMRDAGLLSFRKDKKKLLYKANSDKSPTTPTHPTGYTTPTSPTVHNASVGLVGHDGLFAGPSLKPATPCQECGTVAWDRTPEGDWYCTKCAEVKQ